MSTSNVTRSSVVFIKEESVENTFEPITAATQAIQLREGFAITNEPEIIESDALQSGIGKAKPIRVGASPKFSLPIYPRASASEGVEPELGIVYKSLFGSKDVQATERNTVAGSTVSILNVDSGEGVEFPVGVALIVKDATNGYSIRNVDSVSTDALTLNFDLDDAPASGINLGKHVSYIPVSSGHPTFSLEAHQAASSAAYKQAISGLRANSLSFEFPAKNLAVGTIECQGVNYYFNHVAITSSNFDIDFVDDGGTVTCELEAKVYETPIAFAAEVTTKMTAASVGSGNDTITCTYNSSTGKYNLASNGTTFSLLWLSGTNNATGAYAKLGFAKVDETLATDYDSDVAADYDPAYAATIDSTDPIINREGEFLIGDSTDNTCRKASNITVSIGVPSTEVKSICSSTGTLEYVPSERTCTVTGNIILEKYEVEIFDRSINNTNTKFMVNVGPRTSDGNWTPGSVQNIFFKNAVINTATVQDEDGYAIIAVEAVGYITGTQKDVFLNFI